MSGWQTISVSVFDEEEQERERKKLEREEAEKEQEAVSIDQHLINSVCKMSYLTFSWRSRKENCSKPKMPYAILEMS
jgi:hypothetical protein